MLISHLLANYRNALIVIVGSRGLNVRREVFESIDQYLFGIVEFPLVHVLLKEDKMMIRDDIHTHEVEGN